MYRIFFVLGIYEKNIREKRILKGEEGY